VRYQEASCIVLFSDHVYWYSSEEGPVSFLITADRGTDRLLVVPASTEPTAGLGVGCTPRLGLLLF
jgi:hypothetical protein